MSVVGFPSSYSTGISLENTDRRRLRRYAVKFRGFITIVEPHKGAVSPAMEVETQNVSTRGMYFLSTADWKVGTKIECKLHFPVKAFGGRPTGVVCRGKVTRVVPQRDGRVGVAATISHYQFSRLRDMTRALRVKSLGKALRISHATF